MIKNLFTFLTALLTTHCFAQVMTGNVLDSNNQKPIAYVGIGILNKGIGTVSDLNGYFTFDISKLASTDTLRFSIIGYSNYNITIRELRQRNLSAIQTFELFPESQSLGVVEVKAHYTKTKILGNTYDGGIACSGFNSKMLGTELGVVLKYREDNPGLIENVNFNLRENTYDSVMFQVNIYEYNDGEIGKSILKKPLYLVPNKKHGTLTIDLKDSSIYINHDVMLGLELIQISKNENAVDKDNHYHLLFYDGFLGSKSYGRKAAEDTWEKLPTTGGIGFWATVAY
jgi:hypothetical protein